MSDLISVDDAKANLQIPESDTTRDVDLAIYVTAASTIIEDIVGPVIATARTEVFDGGCRAVNLRDVPTAVTAVTENGHAITDYTPNIAGGVVWAGSMLWARYFLQGQQNISVTYTTGAATDLTDVPAVLQLATRELVRIWWQNGQQAHWPDIVNNPDGEIFTPSGFAIPREIYALCKPYERGPSV